MIVNTWTQIAAFAWPDGSAVVYVLLLLITAIVIRRSALIWRKTAPFFLLFIVGQLGLIVAGLLRWVANDVALAGGLRELFIVIEGVATIGLTGRVLFGVALARFRPPSILEDVVLAAAYGIWCLICLHASGVDVMGLVATSAVITGVIAFSMQDTLGNVLGGLALQVDRSVRLGQWIRIDDVIGKVRQIRWRSTTVETCDWETVVIPNSFLVKSKFRILGRESGAGFAWRRAVEFDADSDFSASRVIGVAQDALSAAEIEGLAPAPAVACLMTGVGLGLNRYALHYWIADLSAFERLHSSVLLHLTTAMARAAIPLFAPTLTNVVVTSTERFEKHRAVLMHDGRLQALKSMACFASLTDVELETLVPHLTRAPFARGDVVLRQGNSPRWLYLLTQGTVEIVIDAVGSARQHLTTVSAPSLLGEPGMVSGSVRSVSAIAQTEVECFRLDKQGFAAVLRDKPEVTQVLAERIAAIAALRATAAKRPPLSLCADAPASPGADFIGKVSRFFGLAHE